MGITGTDVSKEAASIVLLDDNFSTIVAAIREGRTVYDNVRKFVQFSVAGNIGKVGVVFLAPFIDSANALQPIQLLWLNLLTDGLLGLGLGVEGTEPNAMERPPYKPGESVFSRGLGRKTIIIGMSIAVLVTMLGYYAANYTNWHWQTMIFCSLAFAQVGEVLASRSYTHSIFSKDLKPNHVLFYMITIVISLQFLITYVPSLRSIMGVNSLSVLELFLTFLPGVFVFILAEFLKRTVKQ